MRRPLLITAALLLGGLLAAAALLPRLVDSDTLRSMLIIAARAHTGRELTVEGDIRLTLLPRPALALSRLSLAEAPGFGPEPFASVQGVRATLRLWPLMRGRLVIANVDIDRPLLRLTVDQNGKRNWADLLAQPESSVSVSPGVDSTADRVGSTIGVGEVSVRGGDILWTDWRSERWARIRTLDFTLDTLDATRPLVVTASATLDVGDPLRSARLNFSAPVQRGSDGVWQSSELRLVADFSGTPVQQALALQLTTQASFDPAQKRLRLRHLALDAEPLQLNGELTVAQADGAPVLGAQLQLLRLDARALAAHFGLRLATADTAVLRHVAGNVEISASAKELNLARFDLQVDDSQWRGAARITQFADPVLRFAVEGDRIDIDRYLPAQAPTPAAPTSAPDAPPAAAVAPDGTLPARRAGRSPADALRRLTQIDLEGTLDLAVLNVGELKLEHLVVQARGGDGRLLLQPVTASLYGGTLDTNVRADARGADPVMNLKLAATDVAAGPLLLDLTGKNTLQGRLTLGAELTAAVASGEALLRSLNGTLRLDGTDGVLKGINADRSVCRARATIAGLRSKDGPECDPSPDTRFSVMRVSGKVSAGVWRSEDLFVEQQRHRGGRFYHLRGVGSVDLPTGEVDYRLQAASLRHGGDGAPDSVQEAPVPLHVSGRPGAFKVRPQLPNSEAVVQRLEHELAPKEGDSKREQRGKALLKGLFGR